MTRTESEPGLGNEAREREGSVHRLQVIEKEGTYKQEHQTGMKRANPTDNRLLVLFRIALRILRRQKII